jgi:hypothetical protein
MTDDMYDKIYQLTDEGSDKVYKDIFADEFKAIYAAPYIVDGKMLQERLTTLARSKDSDLRSHLTAMQTTLDEERFSAQRSIYSRMEEVVRAKEPLLRTRLAKMLTEVAKDVGSQDFDKERFGQIQTRFDDLIAKSDLTRGGKTDQGNCMETIANSYLAGLHQS